MQNVQTNKTTVLTFVCVLYLIFKLFLFSYTFVFNGFYSLQVYGLKIFVFTRNFARQTVLLNILYSTHTLLGKRTEQVIAPSPDKL